MRRKDSLRLNQSRFCLWRAEWGGGLLALFFVGCFFKIILQFHYISNLPIFVIDKNSSHILK